MHVVLSFAMRETFVVTISVAVATATQSEIRSALHIVKRGVVINEFVEDLHRCGCGEGETEKLTFCTSKKKKSS